MNNYLIKNKYIFNSNKNDEKINYYKKVVVPILNIILLIQLIISLIIYHSNILNFIFDSSFANYINLIILILSTCLTKSIDTLFSMPLLANRKEKKIMMFNGLRTLIFLFIFFIDKENILRLIYVFLYLNIFQNLFYIYESKKIVKKYHFLAEFLLISVNLIFISALILKIEFLNLFLISIIFIIVILYIRKNIYLFEIKKFINI